MKHLKTYKLFEASEFFDKDYIDELLDKISDSGIDSLSDIEKNRLKLFSEDDKEVIETIERMGDITNQFKDLNQKMRDIQSNGGDPYYLMEDWMKLNDELRPLEASFRKWGIELGDPRLDRLMRKNRPDAYNNIFESVIYGQSDGFDNQYILDDIKDIILELEDIDVQCRIYINNYDMVGEVIGDERMNILKQKNEISHIKIKINFDSDNPNRRYENKINVDEVIDRITYYFRGNGRVRKIKESHDYIELGINIF